MSWTEDIRVAVIEIESCKKCPFLEIKDVLYCKLRGLISKTKDISDTYIHDECPLPYIDELIENPEYIKKYMVKI